MNSFQLRNSSTSKAAIIFFLFLGVFAISSAATLIRLADAPALTVATYRMLFSSLFLWIIMGPSIKIDILKSEWKFIFGAGFFLALHFALWISSLETTSVASSLVLVTMNPIMVAIGSVLFLHEKPRKILMLSTAVSIIGCALLLIGESRENIQSIRGNFLALGGAAAMSAYLLVGRRSKGDIPFLYYITFVYTIAGCILLALAILSGSELLHLSLNSWKYLLLLAAVPQIIGHSSINWTLRHLHASYLALVILLEPFLGSLLAYFILNEGFSQWTLFGGLLIVISVLVVLLKDLF